MSLFLYSFSGQLCLDTGGDAIVVPTILASPDDQVSSDSVTSFKAGMESSYILFEDGTVDACGRNNFSGPKYRKLTTGADPGQGATAQCAG